ncbi:hypothetical protein R6Q59_008182 [Mikania micrantha]
MKRMYRNVALDEGERNRGSGKSKLSSPETESSDQKGGKDERKRCNTEKRRGRSKSSEPMRILSTDLDPLAEPTSSPVSPSTERRQRDRSVDNLGALLHHSQPPAVKFHTHSSGGESPLKQIPLPPPLPPFKMPDWKFAVEGDFVRLQSTLSTSHQSVIVTVVHLIGDGED